MSHFAICHAKSEIKSNEGALGTPALKHNVAKAFFEVALDFLLATQLFNKIFSDLSQNILCNK